MLYVLSGVSEKPSSSCYIADDLAKGCLKVRALFTRLLLDGGEAKEPFLFTLHVCPDAHHSSTGRLVTGLVNTKKLTRRLCCMHMHEMVILSQAQLIHNATDTQS